MDVEKEQKINAAQLEIIEAAQEFADDLGDAPLPLSNVACIAATRLLIALKAHAELNPFPLDCPMCGRPRSFRIDEHNPSLGFCAIENTSYQITKS